MSARPPAPAPCGSCPYRCDVPSGVWSREEYLKLPRFDGPTGEQDRGVFMCHRQDGRLCAGWVAVHDMDESLGIRFAIAIGMIAPEDIDAVLSYTTDVPVFGSGQEAAVHGLEEIDDPGPAARRMIDVLAKIAYDARTARLYYQDAKP